MVLPTGNLREPRSGSKRADVVIVTKCNSSISEAERDEITRRLKLKSHQKAFFSYIDYAKNVISWQKELPLNRLQEFTLVTGIANATPLVEFLKKA